MKKMLSFLLFIIYSLLSLFGFSFDDDRRIWTKDVIFNIESKSDIFCPDENVWNNGAEYPSVIRLSNGKLLASFEVFSKSETGFRIMASEDSGKTWKECAFVTEKVDESLNAAWNPCLMELSEKVGEYTKGTVILAGVSIDPSQKIKSRISVYASKDSGKSWDEISVVDEAGGIENGVWEPWLVYDNGYVYCFYSDDSDEVCSQTLVYRRSADCVNWEDKKAVVKSDNPDDRPGMPVLTKMGNGKWFMCYEFGGNGDYPVYFKTSDSIDEWDSADIGTQIISKGKKTIGSAPSCIWIPDGGRNGTLIVSGKYGSGKENDLFISSNFGKSFRIMKNPLDYSDKPGFGYHASFFRSDDDGKLYYANTVDYTETLSKISFAVISPQSRNF